jgi:LPXTG-motif cell wall-anchored protein
MRTTRVLAAAAMLAAATLTTALTAAPAAATGGGGAVCTTSTAYNTPTPPWELKAGATATATPTGVSIATPGPTQDAKAKWAVTLAEPLPLWQLEHLTYTTKKTDTAGDGVNDSAVAAYHLAVRDSKGTAGTLVFEPYYNLGLVAGADSDKNGQPDRGEAHTWPAEDGKWWTSTTMAGITAEGGGSYAGNKTLKDLLKADKGYVILGYGLGQGTDNRGTTTLVQDVKFEHYKLCTTHRWDSTKAPAAKPAAAFTSTCTGTTVKVTNSVADSTVRVRVGETGDGVDVTSTTPYTVDVPAATAVVKVYTRTGDTWKLLAEHTWVKPGTCTSPAPSASTPPGTPSLPVTGVNAWQLTAGGAALIAAGAALIIILRRRRAVQFEA